MATPSSSVVSATLPSNDDGWCTARLAASAQAGGIINKQNLSADYIRTLNRNAATDMADAADLRVLDLDARRLLPGDYFTGKHVFVGRSLTVRPFLFSQWSGNAVASTAADRLAEVAPAVHVTGGAGGTGPGAATASDVRAAIDPQFAQRDAAVGVHRGEQADLRPVRQGGPGRAAADRPRARSRGAYQINL